MNAANEIIETFIPLELEAYINQPGSPFKESRDRAKAEGDSEAVKFWEKRRRKDAQTMKWLRDHPDEHAAMVG